MNYNSRFIKLGRDYFNLQNILRMHVHEIKDTSRWRVNVYLKEKEGRGDFLFGSGNTFSNNKYLYWDFDKAEDAHSWVKTALGENLKEPFL